MTVQELADLLKDLPAEDKQNEVAIAYQGNVQEFVNTLTTHAVTDWEDETKNRTVIVLCSTEEAQLKDRWSSAL